MQGKAILWLLNVVLVALVVINSHYAHGIFPLLVGLAMLASYSTFLAITAVRNRVLLTPAAVPLATLSSVRSPSVTIIVPAKNEARVIAATVKCLLRLNYSGPDGRAFELILVDDNSSDETYAVMQRLRAEHPELIVLRRPPGALPGKSAALNDALLLAGGQVIGVFDADARVAPDFLSRTVPALLAPGVGAVQAQKRISNARSPRGGWGRGPRELVRRSFYLPLLQDVEMLIDTACQVARDCRRGAVELRGNGLLVKREALESVRGWNNDTLTDDLDLSTRLHAAGWEIAFCPEAVVWEEGVRGWRSLFRQRRRWVEGSVIRYLDYLPDLVRGRLPLTMKVDAAIFVAEFVLPMWLFFGAIYWLVALLVGASYNPVVLLAIALGNVAVTLPFIMVVSYFQVTKDVRLLPLVVVGVSLYFLHWIPVIVWTVLRLAALRPQQTWAKTEHVGEIG